MDDAAIMRAHVSQGRTMPTCSATYTRPESSQAKLVGTCAPLMSTVGSACAPGCSAANAVANRDIRMLIFAVSVCRSKDGSKRLLSREDKLGRKLRTKE